MNRYQLPNSSALAIAIAAVWAGLRANEASEEFRRRRETMPTWLPLILSPGITADGEEDAVNTVLETHPAAWRTRQDGVGEVLVTMEPDGRFHAHLYSDLIGYAESLCIQMHWHWRGK